jgi:hypothetical protein
MKRDTNPQRRETMTTKYAAIDRGTYAHHTAPRAVYGIGLTPEEAIADARVGDPGGNGEYDVLPITEAAYREVQTLGGAPGNVIVNTYKWVVRTHEEEEEKAHLQKLFRWTEEARNRAMDHISPREIGTYKMQEVLHLEQKMEDLLRRIELLSM